MQLSGFLNKFLSIGILESDTDEEVLTKRMFAFMPIIIGTLAIFWGSIYIYLGHYISAAIPLIYSVISFIGLIRFSKTKKIESIKTTQLLLVLVLPFLLMWSLGGYEAGSYVMIWAFFAPVAALSLKENRSKYWFIVFLILVVISTIMNDYLEKNISPIPMTWIHAFFGLNTFFGFTGIYLMLRHYVNDKNKNTEKILTREKLSLIEKSEAIAAANIRINLSAEKDYLTGLNNRLSLLENLKNILSDENKKQFALCFLDLDNFKSVNDSFGHHIGDEVLIYISENLKKCVNKNDIVYRLGGDEFLVLFKEMDGSDSLVPRVEKIIECIKESNKFKGLDLPITSSIGLSIYPDDLSEEELNLNPTIVANLMIRNSDIAMYKVKEYGRNDFVFFKEEMHSKKMAERKLESELKQAIKNDEFEVYYQPQINILKREVIGMEALVRWINSEKGIISPLEFIPLAEKLGLIIELDRIVMRKAMKEITYLQEKNLFTGTVSLNLSARQLEQDDFVLFVKQSLKESKCKSKWIELEVTESHIMKDPEKAVSILKELSEVGIKISIDDFGVGYSSLTYLKRLPIDKLKIDKSFVDGVPNDKGDAAIINAIIGMANGLNLEIIAEGVETNEQKEFLIDNGCHLIQGYLCSKPLNSIDFEKFLINGCENKRTFCIE